ncbi:MAG: peptide deformylase [Rhodobacteraceae bacterium]|nr:peptide deformylase [Paracoccaceae bacterium]
MLINREITRASAEAVSCGGGCLLIPDITLEITRFAEVVMTYTDQHGPRQKEPRRFAYSTNSTIWTGWSCLIVWRPNSALWQRRNMLRPCHHLTPVPDDQGILGDDAGHRSCRAADRDNLRLAVVGGLI